MYWKRFGSPPPGHSESLWELINGEDQGDTQKTAARNSVGGCLGFWISTKKEIDLESEVQPCDLEE